MTSSTVSSSLSRLLLGAPLLVALSLPTGCSHSAPPASPPAASPVAARRSVPTTEAVNTPAPRADSSNPGAAQDASVPTRASQTAARRDASLASPPLVVGTVDRGDLSETLAEPAPAIVDQRDIDKMFEDSSDSLQKCYRSQGAPSGSEIVVGFVIGTDGRIASVWPVATQVNNVRVTQCVLKIVSGFQFQATPGGTTRATSTIRYE